MLEPSDIFEEIESIRTLFREAIRATYVGDEIEWVVTFGSRWGLDDERVQLTCYFHPDNIRRVVGTVWASDYPWLPLLRVDEPVQVRGRIRRVDAISIDLDIAELGIPEPATHQ